MLGEGQSAGNVPRIGYLGVNQPGQVRHLLEAFRLGLLEHGWVDGQNLHIEYRWAEGVSDRLARLADELVRLKLSLLIAPTTQAIKECRRVTREIPIVMVASNDPVSDGFVETLAKPGGNITGLTFDPGSEIGGKHIELLVQAIPKLTRVAVLMNSRNPTHEVMSDGMRKAAAIFAVRLHFSDARSPEEIDTALAGAMRGRPEALVIHSDGLFFGERRRIADFAAKTQLAAIYPWSEATDVGGLISYGANLADNFRRAGKFVDRILKGATPAHLPIERPNKFDLMINLKTAKALNLTIPPSLLARANQVID